MHTEDRLSIAPGKPFRQPLPDGRRTACLPENSRANLRIPLVAAAVRGVSMTIGFWRVATIVLSFFMVVLVGSSKATTPPTPSVGNSAPSAPLTEHVILFVLEGFGQDSLKGGT